MIRNGVFIYVLLFIILKVDAQSQPSLMINSLKQCDSNVSYPVEASVDFYIKDKKQFANGNATLKIPVGNDIRSNCTVEHRIGKRYFYLFSFVEKDVCKAIHKYLGEFSYEIERSAGLVPGLCPIPQGRYHVHDVLLNFDRITMSLEAFPYGDLRFTTVVIDKTNRVVACFIVTVKNSEA
ncbi:hypothetical protein ILUMI_16313 [Ignelater luminosus]|uniref:MD-2-related lipid-recognition domain-containing protein n=1 Tax=Ignelater luminosus TaxID=2038154 RepID=A0A8K0G307_IGNLU|nr:hypothetical protein ILUMI_16313 [Ignelater luminosus]